MPPTAEPPLPVAPGDVLASKYLVERILGRGGMGFVVAARHRDLGHLVAIKMLLPALAQRADVVERFLREGRAAVQLRSEHATRATDVGLHEARDSTSGAVEAVPYLVMEYLEGTSLGGLARQGPLSVRDAATYVIQACEALDEAHRLGIIHRDLKPDNLFVTRRLNGTPLVKVLDFGISRVPLGEDDRRLTGVADVMGTPQYMAPEQMESARSADARSDVWALGITLYELLTGRLPFQGSNVAEICARVLKAQPLPPRAHRPNLSAEIEDVVLRCLAREPEQRFQSAAELARALAPFAAAPEAAGAVAPTERAAHGADTSDDAPTLYRASPHPRHLEPNAAPSATQPMNATPDAGAPITRDATTHVVRGQRIRSVVAATLGVLLIGLLAVFSWKHLSSEKSHDPPGSSTHPSSETSSAAAAPPLTSTLSAPQNSATAEPSAPSTPNAAAAPTAAATAKPPPSKPGTTSTSGLKKTRK